MLPTHSWDSGGVAGTHWWADVSHCTWTVTEQLVSVKTFSCDFGHTHTLFHTSANFEEVPISVEKLDSPDSF